MSCIDLHSMVKTYWIPKCATTGYSFPFFPFPLNKREKEKEN